MPDHKTLRDASLALLAARNSYDSAFTRFEKATDYKEAMDIWKEGHRAVLVLKDAHNAVYKHLTELKPKTPKADKLKPGGAIDNPPAKKGKRKADTEAEPTDDRSDDDRDAP